MLMSVWKSDEKLLIFASLISPTKIILFLFSVFHLVMKHCVSFLIYFFINDLHLCPRINTLRSKRADV